MSSKVAHYLKDYQSPAFKVVAAQLTFELDAANTLVTNVMQLIKLKQTDELILDGNNIQLKQLLLDGKPIPETDYSRTEQSLIIRNVMTEKFSITCVTLISPVANTELEGLFVSGQHLATQCEPHGFRQMSYFIDRPDNLTEFTTKLIADKQQYPYLLSNGNSIDSGNDTNDRHFVVWHDPFIKPSYLFAIVAGNFDVLEDAFVTCSGRTIKLQIFVDLGQREQAHHAMWSLKQAMRWDEKKYGREYDLDIFMIVAIRDFNMGAMENKGLNIFNSKYILADPASASDADYERILEVVAHEYFHNWSGNRVTCRDWFQLSLKEGFTVYRDQTFTADYTSEAIKRIDDINLLRTSQFTEDAGPTAHPVQPKSYIEMNNFYTTTVYHKGAELIRMMHTLLGEDMFRKATDYYFENYDGQAVTIEEFVSSMEIASNQDLSQFRLWYHQAGTPEITISDEYNSNKKHYKLHLEQTIPATPDMSHKEPMQLPLAIGLLNQQGEEIAPTAVYDVNQTKQTLMFHDVSELPIPSLLRGFSAPIKLKFDYQPQQLLILLQHDSDVFTRYEASQQLAINLISQQFSNETALIDDDYLKALNLITSQNDDPALIALLLSLPTEKYCYNFFKPIQPKKIHDSREKLLDSIAKYCEQSFTKRFQQLSIAQPYQFTHQQVSQRRLKNVLLHYLTRRDNGKRAVEQYSITDNMTDKLAAFDAIVSSNHPKKASIIEGFYQEWQQNKNVLDKWFAVQAKHVTSTTDIDQLMQNPCFEISNPNVVRALLGSFCQLNLVTFHAPDGTGYQWLADKLLTIDAINKNVAATLLNPLLNWRQLEPVRQQLMHKTLLHIANQPNLSANVYELVTKALE